MKPRWKIDGRVFMGLCMGLGSGAALVIKLWWSVQDSVPPFWLWAIPALVVALGVVGWWEDRRTRRAIRERIERGARRPRPREAPNTTEPDSQGSVNLSRSRSRAP